MLKTIPTINDDILLSTYQSYMCDSGGIFQGKMCDNRFKWRRKQEKLWENELVYGVHIKSMEPPCGPIICKWTIINNKNNK